MTLEEIRTEIDAIDSAMKPLFLRRMECARHVAETKAAVGGDVFVPEREAAVIEHRASDVEAEVREEYIAFLGHLMSVSRRYQYGILYEMEEQAVEDALSQAGVSGTVPHSRVDVRFCCNYPQGNLNLFLNMAALNQVGILEMGLEVKDRKQQVSMLLEGNVNERGMRRLLCQMAQEAEDFRIVGVR